MHKKTNEKKIGGLKINWCLVTLIYSKETCNRDVQQPEKSVINAHSDFQPWILPQSRSKEILLWAFKFPSAETWKQGLDEPQGME